MRTDPTTTLWSTRIAGSRLETFLLQSRIHVHSLPRFSQFYLDWRVHPETSPSQQESSIPNINVQGQTVTFREVHSPSLTHLQTPFFRQLSWCQPTIPAFWDDLSAWHRAGYSNWHSITLIFVASISNFQRAIQRNERFRGFTDHISLGP